MNDARGYGVAAVAEEITKCQNALFRLGVCTAHGAGYGTTAQLVEDRYSHRDLRDIDWDARFADQNTFDSPNTCVSSILTTDY